MQSYHDWYVEEITELEDLTIGMWSELLKIAKWFFHLSYLYLSFTCLIISLVVGLLVSVLTGNQSEFRRKWPAKMACKSGRSLLLKAPGVWYESADIMEVVDLNSASFSQLSPTLMPATFHNGHLHTNFT